MFSLEGYQAIRQAAGLVRRADRGVLRVSGSERLTWLQGLLTNDVLQIPAGRAIDAAYLTPQGRMITECRVIARPDDTLLDVPAVLADALRARLEALLFAEDAQIEDASASLQQIDLHGPYAPDIVAAAALPAEAVVIRHDVFELPGFTIVAPPAAAEAIVAALAGRGGVETSLATLDVVRVEAGRPAFLVDMTEQTIPLEAGLEQRAISFTKGCYVGQEVIVRIMHRGGGRVARRLVGLSLTTTDVPAGGSAIFGGEREIGQVTSAAWSPQLEQVIALGYVHRDFTDAGTTVTVRLPAGDTPATVGTLPFIEAPRPSS